MAVYVFWKVTPSIPIVASALATGSAVSVSDSANPTITTHAFTFGFVAM